MTPVSSALHAPRYTRGLMAVLAGGFVLSFIGPIFRMLEEAVPGRSCSTAHSP
jgi:hypothetical protein